MLWQKAVSLSSGNDKTVRDKAALYGLLRHTYEQGEQWGEGLHGEGTETAIGHPRSRESIYIRYLEALLG